MSMENISRAIFQMPLDNGAFVCYNSDKAARQPYAIKLFLNGGIIANYVFDMNGECLFVLRQLPSWFKVGKMVRITRGNRAYLSALLQNETAPASLRVNYDYDLAPIYQRVLGQIPSHEVMAGDYLSYRQLSSRRQTFADYLAANYLHTN